MAGGCDIVLDLDVVLALEVVFDLDLDDTAVSPAVSDFALFVSFDLFFSFCLVVFRLLFSFCFDSFSVLVSAAAGDVFFFEAAAATAARSSLSTVNFRTSLLHIRAYNIPNVGSSTPFKLVITSPFCKLECIALLSGGHLITSLSLTS